MTDYHDANGCVFVAENDMIVAWERKTGLKFEPETTAWLFERLEERAGVFVDCGASTGWFAVPVARNRGVVAIEPLPEARARLTVNAEVNDATFGLRVVPAAASNGPGKATLWRNPAVPITSGASIEAPTCARPVPIEVQRVTLDEVLAGALVAAIKIDVEGHELSVLEGAEMTIARERPPMVLEANTAAHVQALAGWLAAHDYDWRIVDERNMLCLPR